MIATARDAMVWAPIGQEFSTEYGLVHNCTLSVVASVTVREALDPMALGTCRFCGERLPAPAEDGGSNRSEKRPSDSP